MKEETKLIKPIWNPAQLIAERLRLNTQCVNNVISLLDEGATIPFIARYRKDITDNMEPDVLRDVAAGVEELRAVETKLQTVYSSIKKMGKLTEDLDRSLRLSTSIMEVEAVYAPFKPGHKGSYAERARALGLESLAKDLLDGESVSLSLAVNVQEKGLESVGEVEKGVKHIIADIVSKDKVAMEEARNIAHRCNTLIESSKGKSTRIKKEKYLETGKTKHSKENARDSQHKFQQYFEFKVPVTSMRPHQTLALNRGEDLKILSVKITVPPMAREMFINFAVGMFMLKVKCPQSRVLVRDAILDAYDRLIEPALCRQIRSDLTKNAEKASITVFTSNLKKLLLAQPVKNKTILGIDPGFRNGCKLAIVSPTSQVLWTGIVYLHQTQLQTTAALRQIATVVNNYKCEVIAVGNGVACRETEQVISNMIRCGHFYSRTVAYCIVDECGASIYSISDEAKNDLPDLDPTLRGAVSLARRLLDPLAELVKIEPKHLGVGMYQHDINNNKLHTALNSVVEECVSFVGVDINTCSQSLLRQVAGLNATKAKNLLEWRTQNGFFTSRQQLLGVKGLGKKGFEQCAGFVRVSKHTAFVSGNDIKVQIEQKVEVKTEVCTEDEPAGKTGRKRKAKSAGPSKKKAKIQEPAEWNPLDATPIHPESYDLANKLASHLAVSMADIGTNDFICRVKGKANGDNLKKFCDDNNAGLATVQFIVETFKQPLLYDFRENFQRPLFKQEVKSFSDLHRGTEVTGRVTNVTPFGAFVDIGVGINGLIHTSKMGHNQQPGLGDHVTVRVDNIDVDRRRIGLALKCISGVQN